MTVLPEGMHDVPSGHVPTVVTYLEMHAPGMVTDIPFPDGVVARRETCTPEDYRALFRDIGAPWLWSSRLELPRDDLAVILQHKDVATWIVRRAQTPIGLVEVDHRTGGDAELAYFGLIRSETGRGLGAPMMSLAQSCAFARPIGRFFVHTCTLDDPRALAFYQKAGFTPYKRAVETFLDPRITGLYDRAIAPQIPLLT